MSRISNAELNKEIAQATTNKPTNEQPPNAVHPHHSKLNTQRSFPTKPRTNKTQRTPPNNLKQPLRTTQHVQHHPHPPQQHPNKRELEAKPREPAIRMIQGDGRTPGNPAQNPTKRTTRIREAHSPLIQQPPQSQHPKNHQTRTTSEEKHPTHNPPNPEHTPIRNPQKPPHNPNPQKQHTPKPNPDTPTPSTQNEYLRGFQPMLKIRSIRETTSGGFSDTGAVDDSFWISTPVMAKVSHEPELVQGWCRSRPSESCLL